MKKAIALMLIVFLLPTMMVSVRAETTNATGNQGFSTYCSTPDNMEPFIYGNVAWDGWAEYIGDNICQLGYLYVKNEVSQEITLLLSEPVLVMKETREYVYCITQTNTLKRVDYTGTQATVLYQAQNGALSDLEYYAGSLFFIDGDSVLKYDLMTNTANVLLTFPNVATIFPYAPGKLMITDILESYYVFDFFEEEMTQLPNQYAAEEILCPTYIPGETAGLYVLTPSAGVTSYFPLPDYPVGSYFTEGGEACGDHYTNPETNHYDGKCNCTVYAGASQCVGFAFYAHDQYGHFVTDGSGPSRPPNCTNTAYRYFQNESAVRAALSMLTPGDYLCLDRFNSSESHALVIAGFCDDGIITYECNTKDNCNITMRCLTYAVIYSKFDAIEGSYTHNYPSTQISYTSTHHRCDCTRCDAYTLKTHYTTTVGGNTCDECGYVGTIPVIVP